MTALELFRSGKLNDAVQALVAEVKSNPTDAKRRTFLFELLCFAGDFDRADKQLEVLSAGGQNSTMGALLYKAAVHAERTRADMFTKREWPRKEVAAAGGTRDGKPFGEIVDSDPRIGGNLEVFAAGNYMWIPFEHIAQIDIPKPTKLRDLLWTPALIRTGPSFKQRELGEVLLPVLAPGTAKHADDQVRLGHMTVWEDDGEYGQVPFGQKMLTIDGEDVPLLEIRKLTLATATGETHAAASS